MCKTSPLFFCLAVVLGIILAIAIAVLFFFGLLPGLFAILPYILIFVALSLIAITIIAIYALTKHSIELSKCICCFGKGIVFAALVSLILFLVLYSIPASLIAVTVVLAFLFLSLFLLFAYVAAFIYCVVVENCRPCMPPK